MLLYMPTDLFKALMSNAFIVEGFNITVFYLITANAPKSPQSSNLVVFRLQPVYLYLLLYKTVVVGTHLNCLTIQISTNNICF